MSPVAISGDDKQGVAVNGVQVKQALSAASETVNKGIYDATTLSAVDADLATANIKSAVTIFGKVGVATVQDISAANAVVANVLSPDTFFSVTGGIKTGTMPTVAIVAGSSTYSAGYHAGNAGGLEAIDTDLVAANIKSGVTIFGIAGTAGPVFSNYQYYANLASTATYTPTAKTLAVLLAMAVTPFPNLTTSGIHVEFYDTAAWVDGHSGSGLERSCNIFQDTAQNLRVHNGNAAAQKFSLTGMTWA